MSSYRLFVEYPPFAHCVLCLLISPCVMNCVLYMVIRAEGKLNVNDYQEVLNRNASEHNMCRTASVETF